MKTNFEPSSLEILETTDYEFTYIILSETKDIETYAKDLLWNNDIQFYAHKSEAKARERCYLKSHPVDLPREDILIQYIPLKNENHSEQLQYAISSFKHNNQRYTFFNPIVFTSQFNKVISTAQMHINELEQEINNLKTAKIYCDETEITTYNREISALHQNKERYINEQNELIDQGTITTIYFGDDNCSELEELYKAIASLKTYGSTKCKGLGDDEENTLTPDQSKGIKAMQLASKLEENLISFVNKASTDGIKSGEFKEFVDQFNSLLRSRDSEIISTHNNEGKFNSSLKSAFFNSTGKNEILNIKKAADTLYKSCEEGNDNSSSLINRFSSLLNF